jgi:ferritin-like metal-binding protein YciE
MATQTKTASKTTAASSTKAASSKDMKNSKFHELFLTELKDIYWAEKNLVKALPKMSKAATSTKLSKAIDNHLTETEDQVKRLEEVFELLGEKAQAKKCEAMAGLLEEATEILEDTDADTMVRDAGIIIACQKVEHYEIASYGSLVALAEKMGHNDVAKKLQETLDQEKNADVLLTELAVSEINDKAAEE